MLKMCEVGRYLTPVCDLNHYVYVNVSRYINHVVLDELEYRAITYSAKMVSWEEVWNKHNLHENAIIIILDLPNSFIR